MIYKSNEELQKLDERMLNTSREAYERSKIKPKYSHPWRRKKVSLLNASPLAKTIWTAVTKVR